MKRKSRGKPMYPGPVYQATFADGITVRFSFWQTDGEPWDFEHARKCARSLWGERNLHYRLLFDAADRGQFDYRPTARDIWYAKRNNAPMIVSAHIDHKTLGRFDDPLDHTPDKPKRTTVKDVKAALAAVLEYLDGKHSDVSVIDRARTITA